MMVRAMAAALAALALFGIGAATAQDYPTRPVRIITGFAAGGIGDLGARLLADTITKATGQQAVVENRTGAAGTLGTDAVAKAAPDGYTLGLILNGNLVINPVRAEVDAVRPAQGRHPGRRDRRRAADDRDDGRAAGQDLQGVPGARQGEAEDLQLRLGRRRLAAASVGGGVRAARRHRAGPRALPRQRAGDGRPAGRAHPPDLRLDRHVPRRHRRREAAHPAHRAPRSGCPMRRTRRPRPRRACPAT